MKTVLNKDILDKRYNLYDCNKGYVGLEFVSVKVSSFKLIYDCNIEIKDI